MNLIDLIGFAVVIFFGYFIYKKIRDKHLSKGKGKDNILGIEIKK